MGLVGWIIIGVAAIVLGLMCLSLSRRRCISIRRLKGGDSEWKIRTEMVPSPVARLLGAKITEITYVGRGKVWYELPSRERCDLELGKWLLDQWKKEHRRRARLHLR